MALFVVAYDIADPKRLRRVARFMERHALRTQRSVFLFAGTAKELEGLLSGVSRFMRLDEDLVQAWCVKPGEGWLGRCRGTPIWLFPDAVIASSEARQLQAVERDEPAGGLCREEGTTRKER